MSWLALCPDDRVTGGVVKNNKSRKVISRVATALRRAAQSAANSRSALGGFYRRLRARLGPAKAITGCGSTASRTSLSASITTKPGTASASSRRFANAQPPSDSNSCTHLQLVALFLRRASR